LTAPAAPRSGTENAYAVGAVVARKFAVVVGYGPAAYRVALVDTVSVPRAPTANAQERLHAVMVMPAAVTAEPGDAKKYVPAAPHVAALLRPVMVVPGVMPAPEMIIPGASTPDTRVPRVSTVAAVT